MSVIAQAIADRQGEIDRLQAEIKALTDVEQLLGASAPATRSASRRSSPRKATAASTESQPEAKPRREAPRDDGRGEEGGIGAHDRLLGRTEEEGPQEEGRQVVGRLQLPAPVLDTALDNGEPVPSTDIRLTEPR